MDTKKISVLLKAVELGSYSKAAERLGYTPSALSHIIRAVETECGFPLLAKNYKGVSLTKEGQELIPYLRQLIDAETNIKNKIFDMKHSSPSRIRLASYPSMTYDIIPQAISRFQKSYPDVQFQLSIVSGSSVAELVACGNVDIGLTDSAHIQSAEWTPLRTDHYQIAVPASWIEEEYERIPLESLKEYTYLLSDYTNPNLCNSLKDLGFTHFTQIYSNNGQSMLALIGLKLGISLLTELDHPICPYNVRMFPTEPEFTRELGVIANSFDSLNYHTRFFIETLEEVCEDYS